MMFRLLPAAAMTATALAAMTAGAATVDVYGVVDTGLHYVKADSGDTSVTMDSGISNLKVVQNGHDTQVKMTF